MSKLKKVLIGVGIFVVLIVVIALVATQGIADVARDQLKALRDGDMIKAYAYTSKDFRSATTLENFEKFVNSYPSLKNNQSAVFSDREISNDVGTLKGTLKSKDGASTPIEYKLVKENNEWKILAIRVNPAGAGINQEQKSTSQTPVLTPTTAAEQVSSHKGKIIDIRLNEAVDDRGVVDQHKSEYTSSTPEIFVSAYVEGADKGNKVTAEMVYLKSNEKVGPVTNEISEDGDRISNFSFTKPTKGWPAGEYKVTITLLNNEKKEVSFSVQ